MTLTRLPTELLFLLVSFLDRFDLNALIRTNKFFHRLFSTKEIWISYLVKRSISLDLLKRKIFYVEDTYTLQVELYIEGKTITHRFEYLDTDRLIGAIIGCRLLIEISYCDPTWHLSYDVSHVTNYVPDPEEKHLLPNFGSLDPEQAYLQAREMVRRGDRVDEIIVDRYSTSRPPDVYLLQSNSRIRAGIVEIISRLGFGDVSIIPMKIE